MGRGRAKAKQQKVARDLKYNTHHTDLSALQHELSSTSGGTGTSPGPAGAWDDDAAEDDGYEERWASAR